MHVSVRAKLLMVAAATLALTALVTAIGIIQFGTILSKMEEVHESSDFVLHVLSADANMRGLGRDIRGAALSTNGEQRKALISQAYQELESAEEGIAEAYADAPSAALAAETNKIRKLLLTINGERR